MQDGLANKVGVATGRAQGIGAACTEVPARAGSRVAILDINSEMGEETANRLGENLCFFKM
jgi:NAD(P)-dependent dehydrogenase (short-subunit alcohol dehydrogenase family)